MRMEPSGITFPASDEDARAYVRESLLMDAHLGGYRRVRDIAASTHAKAGITVGPDKPFVCVLGAFDGLHIGHRALIDAAAADAASRGVPLAIVTFDPDPSEVLGSRSPRRLLQGPQRVRALGLAEADAVISFKFNRDFSQIPYDQFITDQLAKAMKPVSIHVGSDFTFGAGGAGTAESLAELGRVHGFEVFGHDLVMIGRRPVSSTLVRELVETGDLDGARDLLCRSHYLKATMVAVEEDGGGVCELDPLDCVPANGKYAGYAVVDTFAIPSMLLVRRQGPSATPAAVIVPLAETGLRPTSSVRIVFVRRLSGIRQDNPQDSSILTVRECVNWVHDYLGVSRVEVGR